MYRATAGCWPVLTALEARVSSTLNELRAKASWVVAYADTEGTGGDAALAFARQVAGGRWARRSGAVSASVNGALGRLRHRDLLGEPLYEKPRHAEPHA